MPARIEPPAPHLMPLGGDWAVWRLSAVRSAGLPFDWLEWLTGPSLERLLAEPAFVAALAWQNPAAVRNWVGACAAEVRAGRPMDGRIDQKRAALLARYAQRYCAKNESIGFFGPVGWARLDDSRVERLDPVGHAGVRRYDVFFELWAIEALARAWEADERLLPYLPVNRQAATAYAGRTLRRPWRRPVPVSRTEAAVLDAVDGRRPVGEVARLAAEGCAGLDGARAEITRLRDAGVLEVGFRIAADERPEARLRAQVETFGDDVLRKELLGQLDELEEARAAVAAAAFDPVDLEPALADLDHRFTCLTGRPAARNKEAVRTGRTVVYLDCRRDLDVTVGGPLIEALRAPLALLLDSARWLTAETAEAVGGALRRTYAALCRRGQDVALSDLYFAAADVLAGAPGTAIHDVAADFRLRWAEILPRDGGAEEVRLTSSGIAPMVAALFPAGGPCWAAARYHSPDVMLARSADGSKLRWVLGELHVGMNTLENRVFHTQADYPAELAAAAAADMAGGRVVPCYPSGPMLDPRTYPPPAGHVPGRYVFWSFGPDAGHPAGVRSLPATGLRVRLGALAADGRGADGLVAGPWDGRWELPVLEFLGEFLSALVVNHFRIRNPSRHSPRVVVDDVVVCRRGWRFPTAELAGVLASRKGYQPRALAGWLADRGVPRHVFARSALEPKPFYVDLQAPLLLRNLGRVARRLQELPPEQAYLDVQEMLPGPDELWLTDASGRRYTSEFRLVAVDQRPRPRPGLDISASCT
jgi:hypothetical protein